MSEKTQRIIVPIDGSEPSDRALELGLSLAKERGVALEVISVIDLRHVDAFDGYMMTEQQFDELRIAVQEEVVSKAETRLEDAGVAFSTRLLWGGVVEQLLRASEETGVEMIVLGRTGRGFFGRLLEGSVSRGMAMHAKVPVVVVP